MAKPRVKRNKDATASSVARLVEALKFVKLASQGIGQPYQSHVRLEYGRAVAFDGVLAAGIMIQDETTACPHLGQLIAALSKCGEQVSIVQLGTSLSIRSDRLKANVECIDPATVPPIGPDDAAVAVDARLLRSLVLAATLAADSSPRVVMASVWLTSLYAYGTNGHVAYRCEHGLELPGSVVIPKAAIKALVSSGKEVTHLGASASSLTFWFSDGSWLRSQLYSDKWPESTILEMFSNRTVPTALPEHFYAAIEAVAPFSKDNCVRFDASGIRSHDDPALGAKYDVSDLPVSSWNPAYLLLMEDIAEVVDFYSSKDRLYFSGANVEGIICGMNVSKQDAPTRQPEPQPIKNWDTMTRDEIDAEIPF